MHYQETIYAKGIEREIKWPTKSITYDRGHQDRTPANQNLIQLVTQGVAQNE
jgi:hypothetical protein